MFGLIEKFKINRLRKQHQLIMEQALHAQRNGKMDQFAKLSQQADELYKKIQQLEDQSK
jgi:hypothetical protein